VGNCESHRGDEFNQDKLLACIEAADFIVAHNAKYELGWLKRCGMNLREVRVFDTKIAEYVLLGNLAAGDKNMAPRSTSLDHCCRRRGWKQKDPVIDIWMNHGINPITMPESWLAGRCRQDVESTERLFFNQRNSLSRSNRLGVLLTRCLITPMLADMEFTGMKLDKARVDKAFKEHTKRYAELDAELEEFTGGINWGSTKQLAEYLYNPVKGTKTISSGLGFSEPRNWKGEPKRTPTGRKCTDERTLDSLRATTKRQREFLCLRKEIGKLKAALTKNLEFFRGVCKEQKGVFNAVFNQTTTATHRLSSSGIPTTFRNSNRPKSVQFQNLPRKFKPLFTPRRRGWVMAEADGAQLEFRVAAHLGNDARAIDGILAGEDVHKFTASQILGIPEEDITKEQRDNEKDHTFKPLYKGQSGTKAEMAYYATFREKYPDILHMQDGWVHEVLEHGKLVTPWGMRYYWPYAKMSRSGWVNVGAAVFNYPIQALATAEIIPIAIRAFWDRIHAEELDELILPLNTVHDSIICEVHKHHIDSWKEIALQAFTTDVYEYLAEVYNMEFNIVPLGVGLAWGSHWADDSNESEEWNIYRNGTRQLVKESGNERNKSGKNERTSGKMASKKPGVSSARESTPTTEVYGAKGESSKAWH